MAQRHMDRLTSFDTSFLANEKANGHMAIGALLMCEGSAPSEEDFLVHIRSRVHHLPRLRQRLLYPPLGLGTPFWVDYPGFDIHQHLRRIALPLYVFGVLLQSPDANGLVRDLSAVIARVHEAKSLAVVASDLLACALITPPGEMGADVALNREAMALYPFCRLSGPANVLVMPAFHSASISTKMLQELGGATVIGPILVGLDRPVQIVQLGAQDSSLVNMAALAAFNVSA